MRLTINTQDVRTFEPVEPGPYLMNVHSFSEPYESREKKTPMIDVEFAFPDPAMDEKHGRVRRGLPIKGKGAGFFTDFWKAATGEDLPIGKDGGGEVDVDLDQALGKTVQVLISNEKEENGDRIFNRADKIVAAA